MVEESVDPPLALAYQEIFEPLLVVKFAIVGLTLLQNSCGEFAVGAEIGFIVKSAIKFAPPLFMYFVSSQPEEEQLEPV